MASLKEVGERTLIARIVERIRPYPGLGPGDDAAVMTIGEETIAVSTDSVTFRRHMPKDMSYSAFGWMAAAVNLSDISSMGARPIGILPSMLMPPDIDESVLYEIVDGMEECARTFGVHILGGDTKAGEGSVSVTAIGTMDGRVPMTRSGAEPGDVVAVTGTLGSAAAGYYSLESGRDEKDAVLALELPVPRVEYGIALAEAGATSCMDISDGLSYSVNEICARSNVGMDILWESLPTGEGVDRMSDLVSAEHMMLDFGGDYELLFTFKKERIHELYDRDVDFTVIGMVNDSGKAYLMKNGERKEMTGNGYEHFKS